MAAAPGSAPAARRAQAQPGAARLQKKLASRRTCLGVAASALPYAGVRIWLWAVSYTHLRAHETSAHL
eukprot:6378698-Alexandrium_andersonii.AAC.1